jgi:hypothetical protein
MSRGSFEETLEYNLECGTVMNVKEHESGTVVQMRSMREELQI